MRPDCEWCGSDLHPSEVQKRLTQVETTMGTYERDIREIKDKLDNGGVKVEPDMKVLVGVLLAVVVSLGNLLYNLIEGMLAK